LTLSDRDRSWLAALVAPVPAGEFVEQYWTARHLFCRGARDRFAHLLSWNELNAILEHHWREVYRFRLARQGRDLDPTSYADLDGYTPRVRARDLTDHLRCGATLSFDAIDELHPPLTRLAESFEACFRGGTKINIYAGWRALHGLDLHRDNQEIFILQLDGRKRWLTYGFSVDGVARRDLESRSVPPDGAELDETLEPGDLLYIPRGCYHLAVPMDEPTLHLTIGVKLPSGRDVLAWMIGRARTGALAEADVPTLGGAAAQQQFSDQVRAAATAGLQEDLVEQYLVESGSNLKPRPSFSLPFSATLEGLPPGSDFTVRLNAPALKPIGGTESMEWRAGARTFRFPRSTGAVIERLSDGTSWTFPRLVEACAGDLDEGSLRFLLGMLVNQNLVTIRSGAVRHT